MRRLMLLAPLLALSAPAFAESITGDWKTDDGSAIIRVGPCGKLTCGTIARILDPAAPSQDINNPDQALRNRPLVGTPVLSGFTRAGKDWGGGTVYDPKAGRSYKSKMALSGEGTLDVTGCIMFLCRTKHWSRVD
ncbi:DUF2147 domain-containing protein [soil metagenome]